MALKIDDNHNIDKKQKQKWSMMIKTNVYELIEIE